MSQVLRKKCTEFDFGLDSALNPLREFNPSPHPRLHKRTGDWPAYLKF